MKFINKLIFIIKYIFVKISKQNFTYQSFMKFIQSREYIDEILQKFGKRCKIKKSTECLPAAINA